MAGGAAQVLMNLKAWDARRSAAAVALARAWAGRLEARMKEEQAQGRYWTNRTHNALNGLFGTVIARRDGVTIYLCHRVDYGVWLELARDGRHAILRPTRDAAAPQVFEDFEQLLGGR